MTVNKTKNEEFNLTNDPTEEELVEIALRQPLDYKIQAAIALLRSFQPVGGEFWLAYSGGKDSGVILELAKMAVVPFKPVYNVVTIDPPELVQFIKRHHPEVIFNRPEKHLWTHMVDKCKGLPTRHGRWCCEVYKEHGGDGMDKIIGVRVAESVRRAKMWRTVVPNRKTGTKIICPIVYWTDEDVWEFHRRFNVPYCSLYDEGFKRLGCIGCPMAGVPAKEFARWPKYEEGWKRATKAFYERWANVPTRLGKTRFFVNPRGWEGYWDWWISRKAKDNSLGCQLEFLFADQNTDGGQDDDR